MWRKIKSYLRYHLFCKYSTVFCKELPHKLDVYSIYIVDNWAISLKCPCGCIKDVHLNTLTECSPCWSYETKKRDIDITPSIKRTTECRSHFWIRNGKVYWS